MTIQKFAKTFILTGVISCILCILMLFSSCQTADASPKKTDGISLLSYMSSISYQIENRIINSIDANFRLSSQEREDLDKMFGDRYITELQAWTFLAENREEALDFAHRQFGEGYLLKVEDVNGYGDSWAYVIVGSGFGF